jgi:hypothetical protein
MASRPPVVVSGVCSFIHTGLYSQCVQIGCDLRRVRRSHRIGGRGPGPTRVLSRSTGRNVEGHETWKCLSACLRITEGYPHI